MKCVQIILLFLATAQIVLAQEKQFSITSGGGYAFYDNMKRGTAAEFELGYTYNKFFSAGLFLSQNYARNYAMHNVPHSWDRYTLFDVSENSMKAGLRINAYPFHFRRHTLGLNLGLAYNRINHTNSNEIFEVVHERYDYVVAAASGYLIELNTVLGTDYFYKLDNLHLGVSYNFQHFDSLKRFNHILNYHQVLLKVRVPINRKNNEK